MLLTIPIQMLSLPKELEFFLAAWYMSSKLPFWNQVAAITESVRPLLKELWQAIIKQQKTVLS